MIKFLAFVLLLLGLVTGGAFFLLENPDRFKKQISQGIESTTGYEVAVDGELSWRYWPPIAINAEEIQLAAPGKPGFIKLDRISVDIDLMPLLTQQRIVDINEISVAGADISLLVDKSGENNWELPEVDTKTVSPPDTDSTDVPQVSTLQRFQAEDLTISYVDEQAGLDYRATLTKLTTSALSSDRPFDISLVANIQDKIENISASIESTGKLQYYSSNDQFGFDELTTTINLQVEDVTYPEVNLISKGQWRPSQQAVVLNQNDIRVSSANITSTGVVNLSGPTPQYDGVINLQTADPAQLSRDLDIELPVKFLQLTADAAIDPTIVHMRTLEGEFDDSKFTGSATLELSPAAAITADVRIDKLDATTYLADDSSSNAVTNQAVNRSDVPADSELIPVDLLRETRLKTIIRVDELTLEGGALRNAKVEVRNDGKILDFIANASGYDGKMVLSANTQLASNTTTKVKLNLDRLDLPQLVDIEGVTGTLTTNTDINFTGRMMSQLEKTLTGKSTFTIKDGTLDVRPLKSVAGTIDAIRGKTSSISEWPDIMPFESMAGEHVFTNGVETGQVFNANLENLSITALGGVNLQAETLDYDVTTTLKKTETGKFKVSDQLSGIRWPLTCSGKFSDSPADLCLGNDGAISQLVTEILKQDLQRRGNEKIEELINDKVPEEYQDITTELFKNLFNR